MRYFARGLEKSLSETARLSVAMPSILSRYPGVAIIKEFFRQHQDVTVRVNDQRSVGGVWEDVVCSKAEIHVTVPADDDSDSDDNQRSAYRRPRPRLERYRTRRGASSTSDAVRSTQWICLRRGRTRCSTAWLAGVQDGHPSDPGTSLSRETSATDRGRCAVSSSRVVERTQSRDGLCPGSPPGQGVSLRGSSRPS